MAVFFFFRVIFKALDFLGEELDIEVHVLVDELLLMGEHLGLGIGNDFFQKMAGFGYLCNWKVFLEFVSVEGILINRDAGDIGISGKGVGVVVKGDILEVEIEDLNRGRGTAGARSEEIKEVHGP